MNGAHKKCTNSTVGIVLWINAEVTVVDGTAKEGAQGSSADDAVAVFHDVSELAHFLIPSAKREFFIQKGILARGNDDQGQSGEAQRRSPERRPAEAQFLLAHYEHAGRNGGNSQQQ